MSQAGYCRDACGSRGSGGGCRSTRYKGGPHWCKQVSQKRAERRLQGGGCYVQHYVMRMATTVHARVCSAVGHVRLFSLTRIVPTSMSQQVKRERESALSHMTLRHLSMPMTPSRIRRTLLQSPPLSHPTSETKHHVIQYNRSLNEVLRSR